MPHYKKRPKKQKKSAYHGWIAIDKPHGMGSTDVVNKVKWLLKNAQNPASPLKGGDNLPEQSEGKLEGGLSEQSSNQPPSNPDLQSKTGFSSPLKGEGKTPYVKIGHAGTLDPLATGVLMLALGEATKLVDYVMESPKAYLFLSLIHI